MLFKIYKMLKKDELYYYTDKQKHEQKMRNYDDFLKKCA